MRSNSEHIQMKLRACKAKLMCFHLNVLMYKPNNVLRRHTHQTLNAHFSVYNKIISILNLVRRTGLPKKMGLGSNSDKRLGFDGENRVFHL